MRSDPTNAQAPARATRIFKPIPAGAATSAEPYSSGMIGVGSSIMPMFHVELCLIWGDTEFFLELVELVQRGVVDDDAAFGFAGRADLDTHTELARERLLQLLDVRGRGGSLY